MKQQPVLFVISMLSLLMALGGLFMKWQGYANGDVLFFIGLVIYLINRIAFYRMFKNR